MSRSLSDLWSHDGTIPLEGIVERHEMAPWLMAFITAFILLIAFQVVGSLAAILIHVGTGGTLLDLTDIYNLSQQAKTNLLRGNTIGQFFGLGIPVFLFAWFSTRRVADFLRIRRVGVASIVLAVVGLAALMPIVQWLGAVNAELPIPDSIREFESTLSAPLEGLISNKNLLIANLFMIAVTPAICEELLFRGYIQRQLERSMGVYVAVIATGVLFGAYHLQLTKIVPLAVLGIYMAYLTWITGSIIPAVIVHFANNAFAVLVSVFAEESESLTPEELAEMSVPWYWVVGGIVGLIICVKLLNAYSQKKLVEHVRDRSGDSEAS